jgi:hypothetical protein
MSLLNPTQEAEMQASLASCTVCLSSGLYYTVGVCLSVAGMPQIESRRAVTQR